ncbi:hypothetical protein HYT04_00530 [Candidatus Kaiserbacteria bacterium]|nr:hypothetical protein [Candidatus Kaiserbacteria bacterium]
MISLQSIARECGLNDDEAAAILKLSPALRGIGLENYTMNEAMAGHFRKKFAPHRKKPAIPAGCEK